jgi:phage repressor protein C with HTH and peptisase S24 domain
MPHIPSRKEKIEKRLKQIGQNPNWLARKIDRPKQSVYQWIEGANPRDPETIWPAIARALDLPDYRVLIDDTLHLPTPHHDEVRIASTDEVNERIRGFLRGDRAVLPVWQTVLAGAEDECAFVDPDSVQWEEVPALFVGSDVERFVLCVASGTSMSPRIRQGDKIVVRLDPAPPRNTLVIAENPERRRFVKTLRENQHLELHSVNSKYKPIHDTTDWTLIGSVVTILSSYEGSPNIEWDYGKPLRS